MNRCELLEIVESLSRLIDSFNCGRIDVIDFARKVKAMEPLIDQAVAVDCPKHDHDFTPEQIKQLKKGGY